MPALVTHSYFSKDVYEKLDENTQLLMDKNFLNITSQGPDFFYNSLLKRNKKIATQIHTTKVQSYFINMAEYIKKHKLHDNKFVMTFFYGAMLHMFLDSSMHPFIIFQVGKYQKKKKNTHKYNGLHNDMETLLDCYMIHTREEIIPTTKKVHDLLFYPKITEQAFTDFINDIFKSTYNIDNAFKKYQNALNTSYFLTKFWLYDPHRYKRWINIAFDQISGPKFKNNHTKIYSMPFKSKYHYLNMEKREWQHPCLEHTYFNTSFIELYVKTIDEAATLIKNVEKYFKTKKDINYLKTIIPNNNYYTGLNADEKHKFKYFDF